MRVNEQWLKDYLSKSGKKVCQSTVPEISVYRSKWESDYAHMLEVRKSLKDGHEDKIINWMYEPIKLKLYTKTTTKKGKTTTRSIYYIPDFLITHLDGSMEFIEVKGYMRKAGELKYFQAVKEYPCFAWHMVGKESGAWVTIHYKGALCVKVGRE